MCDGSMKIRNSTCTPHGRENSSQDRNPEGVVLYLKMTQLHRSDQRATANRSKLKEALVLQNTTNRHIIEIYKS